MAVTGDGSDHTKPKQLDNPQEVALAGKLRADSHGELPKIADSSNPLGALDASYDRFQTLLKFANPTAAEMFLDYFRHPNATEQEKATLAMLTNPIKPSDRTA